jgi:uncharacterized zinc-type alcohol dehydrogenase-like protein
LRRFTSAEAAFERYKGSFDLMISTVPVPFQVQPFLDLLKLDATLVNVGDLFDMDGINGMALAYERHSLAGSLIGGMKETQAVIDYCASHNIAPDVEIIKPSEIERAYQSVMNKEVRYRFVIDMQNAQHRNTARSGPGPHGGPGLFFVKWSRWRGT